MNRSAIFAFALFFFLLFGDRTYAHSGRTNSSGCHNCNVGSCAGTYHCHGGSTSTGSDYPNTNTTPQYLLATSTPIPYKPLPTPLITPKPTAVPTPQPTPSPSPTIIPTLEPTTTAAKVPESLTINPVKKNDKSCTYDVYLTFDLSTDIEGLAIQASRFPGKDPGSRIDTTNNLYTIKDLDAGTWYINVKSSDGEGNFSEVKTWESTLEPCETQGSIAGESTSSSDDISSILGLLAVGGFGWWGWKASRKKQEEALSTQEVMK